SVNPSVVPNPNNVNDTVTFTATVMPNAGSVPLTGSVTFTNNGLTLPECPTPVAVNSASGQATCVTSSLTAGVDTILAVYSNDPNYLTSSGVATPPQTVQDYALVVSSTPPVEVSQGYTSSSDLFTPQTMSVAPISIQGFSTASGKPLALTCSVTAVFSPASSPALPLCNLASNGLAVAGNGAQGATGLVMDATKASAGVFSVQVNGVDPTTGLKRSSPAFNVIVRSASSPLTLVSGATTGNTGNLTFLLPAGVSLSNLACQSVSGPNLTGSVSPASLGITCSFNPTTIPASNVAQAGQVAITIGTSGSTTTTAANGRHTDLWMAGLVGLPFFGLLGLIGGRKSSRSVFFRLVVIAVICVVAFQAIGCGGSFKTLPANSSGSGGGKTPPGVYNVLVVGTGSDGQIYQAVLQLNVQL
ncbi:MAG TPA: Ig-like domain-containing protein, partial [Acidobacteriaceae bacterium]|nr:Ig-like domain-containing protein [Acidobacteriaceae bacterium]